MPAYAACLRHARSAAIHPCVPGFRLGRHLALAISTFSIRAFLRLSVAFSNWRLNGRI